MKHVKPGSSNWVEMLVGHGHLRQSRTAKLKSRILSCVFLHVSLYLFFFRWSGECEICGADLHRELGCIWCAKITFRTLNGSYRLIKIPIALYYIPSDGYRQDLPLGVFKIGF
ncbi:hypothetical protein U1Q18_015202 [Sarracenia purpurea var. burkii]